MEFDVFEPEEADASRGDCLFALGWGNRPVHEPVRWLIDELVDAGYRVHAATLPVHVTDVQSEWVEPLESYAEDLDDYALLAHSAGGLTAAHADLPGAETRTFLSPWWGEPPARRNAVVGLAAKIPGNAKILPSGLDTTDLLGGHATRRQVEDAPSRVAPAFLRATRRAHATLPPIDEDAGRASSSEPSVADEQSSSSPASHARQDADAPEDAVVFCSLSDRVVSTRAIGERVPAERIELYDGGHELFSSRSREEHVEVLLRALGEGPSALA